MQIPMKTIEIHIDIDVAKKNDNVLDVINGLNDEKIKNMNKEEIEDVFLKIISYL